MFKKHFIIFFLFLSFSSIPRISFACGMQQEGTCCEKPNQEESCGESCCENNSSDKKDNCGGDCNGNSCHCSLVSLHFAILTTTDANNITFGFYNKIEKINYAETFLSSGFYSIWIPPIIG